MWITPFEGRGCGKGRGDSSRERLFPGEVTASFRAVVKPRVEGLPWRVPRLAAMRASPWFPAQRTGEVSPPDAFRVPEVSSRGQEGRLSW